MNSDFGWRLFRTGLQIAGAVVGTMGWMDESTWQALSGALLTIATTFFTYRATQK